MEDAQETVRFMREDKLSRKTSANTISADNQFDYIKTN